MRASLSDLSYIEKEHTSSTSIEERNKKKVKPLSTNEVETEAASATWIVKREAETNHKHHQRKYESQFPLSI